MRENVFRMEGGCNWLKMFQMSGCCISGVGSSVSAARRVIVNTNLTKTRWEDGKWTELAQERVC